MSQQISVSLDELDFMPTAHAFGLKKILFDGKDTACQLTQFAYGKLGAGESIPSHQHPTMEEYFYFLKGKGTYTISDITIDLREGVAVRIPAGSMHILEAEEDLEFLYFGIAV